jgi:potassium voltage-gated channel Eag-related subfamily H protein 8
MDSNSVQQSMFFGPSDPEEIRKIISSFAAKKSTGHDGISMSLLKSISGAISLTRAKVINISLVTGQVPDAMKLTKVIPLFKAKNTEHFTNYRPISLLPICSKILEKIVHKRLYSFLLKHHILYPSQYGFRLKHSTINAVTEFTYDMLDSLDKKILYSGSLP